MSKGAIDTRAMRWGFGVVVVLLTSGAAFSVVSARRAAERIDKLVTASLERERMIGLMRLDLVLLMNAASDRISATSAAVQEDADHVMDVLLTEIQATSTRFTSGLPRSESALWEQLTTTAARLVKKVEVTIKAARRSEIERARKSLEEEAKPITFELDDVASQLAEKNEADTRQLLSELQDVRLRTSAMGGGAVGLALLLSILVAWQVTRTLKHQEETIETQLNELNRRNQELDSFASRVAHDLVSPLSPLKGYLTLARRHVSDPDVKDLPRAGRVVDRTHVTAGRRALALLSGRKVFGQGTGRARHGGDHHSPRADPSGQRLGPAPGARTRDRRGGAVPGQPPPVHRPESGGQRREVHLRPTRGRGARLRAQGARRGRPRSR